ncbi:TolC family protein, partial [Prevotella sp.]
MKRILFTFSLTLLAHYSMAQETLSLGQCLQMGIERNLNLKTYEGNVLKGKHNISENRSRLLPQINIGAALNDNFTPPVSVTNGKAYGKPYNVTKTLQYNSSASVQLQMPLYSQTALTALDISKTLDQLNTLSYAKAKEDLIVQISKMYYLAQNTEEQIG